MERDVDQIQMIEPRRPSAVMKEFKPKSNVNHSQKKRDKRKVKKE